VASALVAYSSYCYSEVINGTTNNAAANGPSWSMGTVLPQESGLTVNGVIYKYTAMKDQQDEMLVNIQNQSALGPGYVFRSQDDWTGLPGNTIAKNVPVPNIPIQNWGPGEIEIEGKGSVVNPTVVYTYKYDTCYNPITDPSCPGYAEAMAKFLSENMPEQVSIDDPLNDKNIQDAINRKAELKNEYDDEEEKKKKEAQKEKEKNDRKRMALKSAENALATAQGVSQQSILEAMNSVPEFNSYYNSVISGGVYADASGYKADKIPENRQALRNGFAQQLLHKQLVESQYDLGRKEK
jgi:hypothetical protein